MHKPILTTLFSLLTYYLLAQPAPTSNTVIETKRYDTQKQEGNPLSYTA